MAWTSPLTAAAGDILTATLWNTHVRNNLLETAVAKATTAGSIFVATGATALAERIVQTATVATAETTATTTYTDLATFGPSVTVASGTQAIIMWSALLANSTSASQALCSYAVSGSSTISASDTRCLLYQASANNAQNRGTAQHLETGLTIGATNTISLRYRASANTASFGNRTLTVIPL